MFDVFSSASSPPADEPPNHSDSAEVDENMHPEEAPISVRKLFGTFEDVFAPAALASRHRSDRANTISGIF